MENYIKEKQVGEGTFAIVFIGTQISTGKSIAIKRIKSGQWKDGIDLSAIREAQFLQELSHPNVIQLIDIFVHKNNLNLVLEFLESDLEMIIKNKNVVFSAGDIKSWMLMTFRGLAHIHDSFILHRDLKPNNLLLASNGQLKIADFGMKMSPVVVTRWYRAPELLLGANLYGYGVDIWAVGCIFAELMLRTPYLAGESDLNQLQRIFQALGTPTEEDWPGMSQLPDTHTFQIYPKTPLKSLFTAAGIDALDLLEKMLSYSPTSRITAYEALDHFYFKNTPRPTIIEKLPKAPKDDQTGSAIKRKFEDDPDTKRIAKRLFAKSEK